MSPGARPARLSCASPGPVSPASGPGRPVPRLCPPRPCPPLLIISPYLLPASTVAPSVSCSPPRTQPARAPPLPGPRRRPSPRPRPRVSRCHWSLPAPVSPPLARPGLPRFQAVPPPRRLREGTGWGRRRPPPTSEAPWAGGGGPAPGASASLLPGTGPRGARPDGLHRELGVLRGAGARAPLRPPTSGEPPGELPGPGAGPVPGARGVGARREQAAPASGRRCGDGCGEWVAGRAHPAHLRQVRSPARKGPVSCWEGGSKGRLPQGPGLDEDLVKAQS